MPAVTIKPLELHKDERGFVYEPVTQMDLNACRNIHVVISLPGAVRGNHYHRKGTETLTVEGPALVRYQQNAQIQECKVPLQEVWQFTFPAGIAHAIQNIGDDNTIIVAANTCPHDPENPDTIAKTLIFV